MTDPTHGVYRTDPNEKHKQIVHCTGEARWKDGVLQQQYAISTFGLGAPPVLETEWRDVPTENSEMRLQSGPYAPGVDWPGIFIRGDEALGYAEALKTLLQETESRAKTGQVGTDEAILWTKVDELTKLLQSCRTSTLLE